MQQPFVALVVSRVLGSRWWRAFHVRAALSVSLFTVVVLVAGSALVVTAERGAPGASITSFPRALWWSVETATTVGYGDLYPVTLWGRVVAGVVMLAGITTFGMVTAAIATWFVGRAHRDARALGAAAHRMADEGERAARDELRSLHERFDRVERLLAERGDR